jgi:DNA repair protein RadC
MTIDTLFGPEMGRQKAKPLRLKVIRPIYESLKVGEVAAHYLDKSAPLSSSAHVAELFAFLQHETKEHFLALHLDSKNRLLCLELVSVGSLNAAVVHPREVYKSALLSSAAAVIFLHNHPSGDTAPSAEDRELTSRLSQAGELLGIRVLDHVIIGCERCFSFADSGAL